MSEQRLLRASLRSCRSFEECGCLSIAELERCLRRSPALIVAKGQIGVRRNQCFQIVRIEAGHEGSSPKLVPGVQIGARLCQKGNGSGGKARFENRSWIIETVTGIYVGSGTYERSDDMQRVRSI